MIRCDATDRRRHTVRVLTVLLFLCAGFAYGQATTFAPLTDGEKVTRAAKNYVHPGTLLPVAIGIGFNQARGTPEEWGQGFAGLGKRTAFSLGRLGLRSTFNVVGHVALHTEPRYDRCKCTGFGARTAHAVRRTFIVRTDAGGERIHIGNFASAYATNLISNQWLPNRYHTQAQYLKGTGLTIGINAGWNVLREFIFRRDE